MNLSFFLQLSQSLDRRLERHDGIGRVQLINLDAIQAQPLETAFNRVAKMRGTCVVRPLIRSRTIPSALGGDNKILRIRKERLGDQLFADSRPVRISGIDEVDAKLHG